MQKANIFPYFKNREDRYDEALEHLVKNNVFLYYKDTLPEIVFCDPQVLLTEVTQIVQQHYKLVNSSEPRVKALKLFAIKCIHLRVYFAANVTSI